MNNFDFSFYVPDPSPLGDYSLAELYLMAKGLTLLEARFFFKEHFLSEDIFD